MPTHFDPSATQIAASKGLQEAEVFDDSTLQYLSALCPAGPYGVNLWIDRVLIVFTDYNSFKTALANCGEVPQADAPKYIDDKWDKYGQPFLELCIQKNTGL